jgi:hypothetical protein
VEAGEDGVHYLDFCGERELCPFSVVIFSYDLKSVGDVRQLVGKVIEIRGELNEYDDRAEIVLENARQLKGQAAKLPPMARNFDVEQAGISVRENRERRTAAARGRRDSVRRCRFKYPRMWSRSKLHRRGRPCLHVHI